MARCIRRIVAPFRRETRDKCCAGRSAREGTGVPPCSLCGHEALLWPRADGTCSGRSALKKEEHGPSFPHVSRLVLFLGRAEHDLRRLTVRTPDLPASAGNRHSENDDGNARFLHRFPYKNGSRRPNFFLEQATALTYSCLVGLKLVPRVPLGARFSETDPVFVGADAGSFFLLNGHGPCSLGLCFPPFVGSLATSVRRDFRLHTTHGVSGRAGTLPIAFGKNMRGRSSHRLVHRVRRCGPTPALAREACEIQRALRVRAVIHRSR